MSTMTATRPAARTARKPARPTHGTCRLTLTINGTHYSVRPNVGAACVAFRLKKPDGTIYDVARTEHGLTCDCPDFVFHREGRDPAGCKHTKAMAACGLLAPAPAATTTHNEETTPMDEPTLTEIAAALAKVDGLIARISTDLRIMPDRKRNTRYHTDRLAERRRLMAQRDYLLARQAELAAKN
jgi:hypothetical protein